MGSGSPTRTRTRPYPTRFPHRLTRPVTIPSNPSHEITSSTSDSSTPPESPPASGSSPQVSSASDIDDGAGSLKSKPCQIAHLIHCRASTMSPLRQLHRFDIVIPPRERRLKVSCGVSPSLEFKTDQILSSLEPFSTASDKELETHNSSSYHHHP